MASLWLLTKLNESLDALLLKKLVLWLFSFGIFVFSFSKLNLLLLSSFFSFAFDNAFFVNTLDNELVFDKFFWIINDIFAMISIF